MRYVVRHFPKQCFVVWRNSPKPARRAQPILDIFVRTARLLPYVVMLRMFRVVVRYVAVLGTSYSLLVQVMYPLKSWALARRWGLYLALEVVTILLYSRALTRVLSCVFVFGTTTPFAYTYKSVTLRSERMKEFGGPGLTCLSGSAWPLRALPLSRFVILASMLVGRGRGI
jgi:Zn-dependent protease